MIYTSDNKKYYYLKLKDDFYETDELKILESMPNGYMYSNLLLKLYLKSLKCEGKLQLNEFIPYNPQMIATITNMNIDIVTAGLKIMEQMKLIEVLANGTIYMIQIQNYIGQSSSEADRKRNYRQKIESERQKLLINGQVGGQNKDKCPTKEDENPPEKEIELDIEKKNIFSSDSNEYRLADYLRKHILKNNPSAKVPNDEKIQSWCKVFDYILRIDKRTVEDVKEHIHFSQTDSFWMGNILSPTSLRKGYDQLTIKIKGGRSYGKNKSITDTTEGDKPKNELIF